MSRHVYWNCDVCGRRCGESSNQYIRSVEITVQPPSNGSRPDAKPAFGSRDLCEDCVTRLLNEFGSYLGTGKIVRDPTRRYRNQPRDPNEVTA